MKILFINFVIFALNQFQLIHDGKAFQKIKASAALGVTISPVTLIISEFTNWFIAASIFFAVIGVALFLDLLFGIIAHIIVFDDFDPKVMLSKFSLKVVLTYGFIAGFGLFDILFSSYGYDLGNYIRLAVSCAILLYPTLSLAGNISVLSGGKFPPKNWIMKLESYQKTLKLEELYDKNKKDKPE